ncbi:RlpA-like double-psi beta-barrel domain-containing protein [Salidesulfovibrio brasiliensis]|uniref:3D domain-containing protein n=1 Tax=Salidesulfovibrio brasiliensis TaxID=221711 RepID=UPI0006D05F4C|nr:3D domain-containing protein [Salidesulfovibrio brasiliensis]
MRFFTIMIAAPLMCTALVIMGGVLVWQNMQMDSLRHKLALAQRTAEARKQMVEEARLLTKAVSSPNVLNVTVTAYNPVEDQCDEDPLIAASMRKVREGTIAVSRDLFDQGWVFGKKVRIEGLGIFEINDLMNKRYSKRIDIFMWDEGKARQFGKRASRAALLEI